MIIRYCEKCGKRVADEEFASGGARMVDEHTAMCGKCLPPAASKTQFAKAVAKPPSGGNEQARGAPRPASGNAIPAATRASAPTRTPSAKSESATQTAVRAAAQTGKQPAQAAPPALAALFSRRTLLLGGGVSALLVVGCVVMILRPPPKVETGRAEATNSTVPAPPTIVQTNSTPERKGEILADKKSQPAPTNGMLAIPADDTASNPREAFARRAWTQLQTEIRAGKSGPMRSKVNEFTRNHGHTIAGREALAYLQSLPPISESDLATGLMAWWKLDEGRGNAVRDASPAKNNGTIRGAANWTKGRTGGALALPGANNWIETSVCMPGPNVFTISLWFQTTTTQGGRLLGFGSSPSGQSAHYDRHVYMSESGHIHFGVFSGAARVLSSARPLNDGAWHHVAARLSSAGQVLFIDGTLVASDSSCTSGEAYDGYWRVGYEKSSGWPNGPRNNPCFNGALSDIRIYSGELSPDEVKLLCKTK